MRARIFPLIAVALSALLLAVHSRAPAQAQTSGRSQTRQRPSSPAPQSPGSAPGRRGVGLPAPMPTPEAAPGRYHAFIIGNNVHQSLPRLRTAEADAQAFARLLHEGYGFEINLKLNATRSDILRELYLYRVRLDPDDSLLIYYAGHGYRDKGTERGYWLPVDATEADPANWISSDDITTNIKALPARHVLIISDSCYSGALGKGDRSGLTTALEASRRERERIGRERAIKRLWLRMSRTLMTSGGDEPVQDSRGDQTHSVFANALLRALREMEGDVFSATDLFYDQKIRDVVAGNSEQQPEYDPLRSSGHDGGDFIFSRRIRVAALVGATTVTRPRVQPGQIFTQSINVTNQGNAPALATRVEFVFNPNFELVDEQSAASYDNKTRSAVWLLGDLDASHTQSITVTLRAAPDALAASYPLGRGTLHTASLPTATDLLAPAIEVGREPKAQIEALKTDLTAPPGETVYLPFVVRNPGNYAEAFDLNVTAPDAPPATLYADTNGDGRHQANEPMVTQTASLQPRNGQFPLLLKVDAPQTTTTRQQFAYNVGARARSAQATSAATTTLTVAAVVSRVEPPPAAPTPSPTPTPNVVPAVPTDAVAPPAQSVRPGDVFTQTLTVRNERGGPMRAARADFIFNPVFELITAEPAPLTYDRDTHTAIWSLGDLLARDSRTIKITLRVASDALAATQSLWRATLRTSSLPAASDLPTDSIEIRRVPKARIDAVSTGLTATPGDSLFVPFVVRNPGNHAESYDLRVTAPNAPQATLYADTNGDGQHQDAEPIVAQTAALEPRTGQYPLLLRVDVPRQTPDGQQFAYNIVSRALASTRVAAEANTVITVAAPRVRVRVEMAGAFEPGESSFYRLVLVNDGGGLAKNLVLTEVLAETLQFISSEPRLDASDAAGGGRRVVWRVAELAPGDTTILRITARLGANLPPTTDVSASRTLSYQDTNGNTYAPGDGAGASVKLPAPGANAASVEPPSDAEQAMFGRGQTLYNQGRYEQSIAAFSDLLKTYPNSSITDLTLLWLGRAYIATGRLLNAEQLGERLRSIKNSPFIEIYQNELAAARKAATPKDVPAAKPEGLRTTPERAPATPRPAQELKRVYSVSSSDAPAGSRVTITAGDPLADYSAYRSGDRFYVVIPQATAAPRMLPLRPGRGFDNMQIQLRGQDVIFSFKLQPGASARVEQQFNRLVVQFSVPNK